jgi:glycosyl transferase family 25
MTPASPTTTGESRIAHHAASEARPVAPRSAPTPAQGNGTPIPIFVINLARDVARMATIQLELERCGLSFERIDAFNGPALLPRVQRWCQREFFSPRLHRPLTRGEVGCALSHVRALRTILARRLPYAIVFEDDVVFADGFVAFVRDELPHLLTRASVIKLEGIRDNRSSRRGVRLAKTSAGDLFVPLRPALGSAGYAVNATAARQLFTAFKRVDRPIDHMLGAYEQHGAIYAEFSRFPVRQSGEDSNIKAERQNQVANRHTLITRCGAKTRMAITASRRLLHIASVVLRRKLVLR